MSHRHYEIIIVSLTPYEHLNTNTLSSMTLELVVMLLTVHLSCCCNCCNVLWLASHYFGFRADNNTRQLHIQFTMLVLSRIIIGKVCLIILPWLLSSEIVANYKADVWILRSLSYDKEDEVWSWHLECRYEASRLLLAENGPRRQHRFYLLNYSWGGRPYWDRISTCKLTHYWKLPPRRKLRFPRSNCAQQSPV